MSKEGDKVRTSGRTKPVQGDMSIQLPECQAFQFETPPGMPKAHGVTLVVGKRGAGKTVACCNLLKKMEFDRIFILSPTIHSNKEMIEMLGADEDDIYTDTNDIGSILGVKEAIEKERDDLEEYLRDKKQFDALKKRLEAAADDIPDWTAGGKELEDAMLKFYSDGDFKPPYHKWGGKPPKCCLLLDDLIGSKIYQEQLTLNNLAILHRHVGQLKEGGAVGISLYFLVQSYKAQHGGLSRPIRNQTTSFILFQSKNIKELEEIAEEVGGEVDMAQFFEIYNRAIRVKHDFLFIDLHKKDEHASMFRRNFDEFLLYDGCDTEEVAPVTDVPCLRRKARDDKKENTSKET